MSFALEKLISKFPMIFHFHPYFQQRSDYSVGGQTRGRFKEITDSLNPADQLDTRI